MKRTFLGTVTAINPTDTSSYSVGRHEVTIVAYSAELGGCNSTFRPSLTHEETRELGALFGKPNAVRITIEMEAGTVRVPSRDDAKPGEYYAHGSGNVYRRSRKGDLDDAVIAEAYGDNGPGASDYSGSCQRQAQRIAALLNGASGEHPAVAILKEVLTFVANTDECVANWLLDFAKRPDVLAATRST